MHSLRIHSIVYINCLKLIAANNYKIPNKNHKIEISTYDFLYFYQGTI